MLDVLVGNNSGGNRLLPVGLDVDCAQGFAALPGCAAAALERPQSTPPLLHGASLPLAPCPRALRDGRPLAVPPHDWRAALVSWAVSVRGLT